MAEHKPIPEGWRFYTADFSIPDRQGRVMLTRDADGYVWWNSLDETGKENTSLFLTGYGDTINQAIDNAAQYCNQEVVEAP